MFHVALAQELCYGSAPLGNLCRVVAIYTSCLCLQKPRLWHYCLILTVAPWTVLLGPMPSRSITSRKLDGLLACCT